MVNIYSAIKESNLFPKMEVNELLFVEYTCLKEISRFGIWSNNNYFAFISSGKKIWRSIYHSYEVDEGDIIFVKKGANLTHQFTKSEFCAIFIFVPDDFILAFLKKYTALSYTLPANFPFQDSILRIQPDELLKSYYQSIRSYLYLPQKPNAHLLVLKFEELLLSLFSNKQHKALTDYFISLCQNKEYNMSRVMEENFSYNLRLQDYARLCHMSLSAFKTSFKAYYHTTPAVWLKTRKLELAYYKVVNTDLPIGQVSFECGFEDNSHFIKVFKQKYYSTPLQCRLENTKALQELSMTI